MAYQEDNLTTPESVTGIPEADCQLTMMPLTELDDKEQNTASSNKKSQKPKKTIQNAVLIPITATANTATEVHCSPNLQKEKAQPATGKTPLPTAEPIQSVVATTEPPPCDILEHAVKYGKVGFVIGAVIGAAIGFCIGGPAGAVSVALAGGCIAAFICSAYSLYTYKNVIHPCDKAHYTATVGRPIPSEEPPEQSPTLSA